MTKDPICEMTLVEAAALHAEREEQGPFFCRDHCRRAFPVHSRPSCRTADRGEPEPGNRPNTPKKPAKLVCAAALTGGILFAGCASRPPVNGVPNFAEVEAGNYRGGQPNEQGWQFLRSLGITNVVKLNREVADAPADGMTVYCIPLPPATIWEMFQKPDGNEVSRAVQAMSHGGTYVHCQRGRDRPGLVVGCYRMWIDGWSESAAAREMGTLGYRWSIPGLTAFWRSVTRLKKD